MASTDEELIKLLNYFIVEHGLHKVLGALIWIYNTKGENEENMDYLYISRALTAAGANIHNNTNVTHPSLADDESPDFSLQ